MESLWRKPAAELAMVIASGRASAVEVMQSHLGRITAVNSGVNAIVRVLEEEALLAAKAADRTIAEGAAVGPLHGVPFTVKENIDVAGLPTTWGVPALAGAVAPADAPVVERMRVAGALLLGRTNLSDMALRIHTESSLYGTTLNPWNPDRTCSGSSGGEAVALATGMSPLGIGNDIGGSLRSPAYACGIVSIKPSAGRVPDAGHFPTQNRLLSAQLLNAQGPMARTVADVKLALRVMMGAHPRDPWSIDAPYLGRPADRPIRVALAQSPCGGVSEDAVRDAVQAAANALADRRYEVVEVCPPRYKEAEEVWANFLIGDFSSVMGELGSMISVPGMTFLDAFAQSVEPLSDCKAMSRLFAQRDGIAREWSVFLEEYPLVLTPTWTHLPFELGFEISSPAATRATRAMIAPMMPANLLGLPSACVPAGFDRRTGLPVGVLVTGRRFREDQCLDAAEAIEARSPIVTPIDPVTRVSRHATGARSA